MVRSSVGYLLEKSAKRWCQMGSLEPFVADIWPDLPEGVCLLVTGPALGIGSQWTSGLPR